MTSLATRGVGFRSIIEAIDTPTPDGLLVFHLLGALGQFERDLIHERTGRIATAARGRKGGRNVVTGESLVTRAIIEGVPDRKSIVARAAAAVP